MVPTWMVMVSALLAIGALTYRWSVERRAILLIKFPPAIWLAFLYAGTTFSWFGDAQPQLPTGVGAFIRLTFCMLLLAQAVTDYFTAREIKILRRGIKRSEQ